MAYKINIRDNTQWVNILKDAFLEITDSNGYFTSSALDGVLDELHEGKTPLITDTSDPTNSDDGDGIGAIWVNTTTDRVFACVDDTTSSAIWVQVNTSTVLISSNTSLLSNTTYMTDVSSSGITLTLPSSPSNGDKIIIIDSEKNSGTNNISVLRNGNTIDKQTNDLDVDVDGARVILTFCTDNTNWNLHYSVL